MTTAPQSTAQPAPPLRGEFDTDPPWFPTQDEIAEERGRIEEKLRASSISDEPHRASHDGPAPDCRPGIVCSESAGKPRNR